MAEGSEIASRLERQTPHSNGSCCTGGREQEPRSICTHWEWRYRVPATILVLFLSITATSLVMYYPSPLFEPGLNSLDCSHHPCPSARPPSELIRSERSAPLSFKITLCDITKGAATSLMLLYGERWQFQLCGFVFSASEITLQPVFIPFRTREKYKCVTSQTEGSVCFSKT